MRDTVVIDPVSRWILRHHAENQRREDTDRFMAGIEQGILEKIALENVSIPHIGTYTHGRHVYDIMVRKENVPILHGVGQLISVVIELQDREGTYSLSSDVFICRATGAAAIMQATRADKGRLRLGELIDGMSNRMPKITKVHHTSSGMTTYSIEKARSGSWTRARADARRLTMERTTA